MALNLVGFDSAWSDNPKAPGAICACRIENDRPAIFHEPRLARFDEALALIEAWHFADDVTLVAIDQPTIVRNQTNMRPAERVVASVMSWSGGAIQPAYRDKAAMFGDGSPIERFLAALGFADDPEAASTATCGGFVMEVYPALALLSLEPAFAAAGKRGPRYNPARKTFSQAAWRGVCDAAEREARRLALDAAAAWCAALDRDAKPSKARQDCLDALLCLLIAARWRGERAGCAMVGDLATGYIVAPVDAALRERLARRAADLGVAIR